MKTKQLSMLLLLLQLKQTPVQVVELQILKMPLLNNSLQAIIIMMVTPRKRMEKVMPELEMVEVKDLHLHENI